VAVAEKTVMNCDDAVMHYTPQVYVDMYVYIFTYILFVYIYVRCSTDGDELRRGGVHYTARIRGMYVFIYICEYIHVCIHVYVIFIYM